MINGRVSIRLLSRYSACTVCHGCRNGVEANPDRLHRHASLRDAVADALAASVGEPYRQIHTCVLTDRRPVAHILPGDMHGIVSHPVAISIRSGGISIVSISCEVGIEYELMDAIVDSIVGVPIVNIRRPFDVTLHHDGLGSSVRSVNAGYRTLCYHVT